METQDEHTQAVHADQPTVIQPTMGSVSTQPNQASDKVTPEVQSTLSGAVVPSASPSGIVINGEIVDPTVTAVPDHLNDRKPKAWLWRTATAVFGVVILVANLSLIGMNAGILFMLTVSGFALLILNIVTIKRAHGAASRWLLMLSVPVFALTVLIFLAFGIIAPAVGPGNFTSSKGYSLVIPDGYRGRVDKVHGAIMFGNISSAPLTSSVSADSANSTTVPTFIVIPAPFSQSLASDAGVQSLFSKLPSTYSQQGYTVLYSNLYTSNNHNKVIEIVLKLPDGRMRVAGGVFPADYNRQLLVYLFAPSSESEETLKTTFEQLADTIKFN